MDEGVFKGVDIGGEHKSNGKSGADSRSWNRFYAEARTEFKLAHITMGWNTRVFYLYDLDEGNRDIRHQLGFLETSLIIRGIWPSVLNDGEAYITLNPGGNWNPKHIQGSREIGFRFRTPIKSFDPYIFFQLYSGMNESQLMYKQDRTTWRIGLAI
jgi:outer membrane phospholipase A